MRSSSRSKPVRNRVWNVGRFLVLVTGLLATSGCSSRRLAGLRVRVSTVPDLRASRRRSRAFRCEQVWSADRRSPPDRKVPPDHVLDQDPAPGAAIRRQRAVRVRLSDGARDPVVPVVTDLPQRAAEMSLTSNQVAIGYAAEVRAAEYRADVVVAQDPPAGRRAATVNLLLNRTDAAATFVAPDLIGSLAVRAAQILRAQGFRAAVTSEVTYPGIPPGVVVRQTPQAGYRIRADETITLEVSR
jgi:serine/threonine-protein kinase